MPRHWQCLGCLALRLANLEPVHLRAEGEGSSGNVFAELAEREEVLVKYCLWRWRFVEYVKRMIFVV